MFAMIEFARWFSAVTLLGLAVFQTWVVIKGFGHQLVLPVLRYGAAILWLAAIYRLCAALHLYDAVPWIRNGTFGALLTVLLGLAISLAGVAAYTYTKNVKANGLHLR